jgi:hypothetical protein
MSGISDFIVRPAELEQLLKLSQKIRTGVQRLKTASDQLNMRDYRRTITDLEQDIGQFWGIWQEFIGVSHTFAEQMQEFLNSADYAERMNNALTAGKIPCSGDFPNYDIPPFKLSIKLNQSLAKLSLGKKSSQTYALAPTILADWVVEKYRALLSRPFAQTRFCKELLSVYPYLNQGNWGTLVPLQEVYKLLTLKTETRQEYPESHFIFDLGRLLEQYEITYEGYYFDFSSHKETKKNYTIVNPQGREKAIGMMSIRQIPKEAQEIQQEFHQELS